MLHAAESDSTSGVREELGDVCFVLSLVLVVAHEEGLGDLPTILAQAIDKIQRRHPHVFQGASAITPQDVEHQWQEIKRAERNEESDTVPGPPGEIPVPNPALSALQAAERIQARAARVGFDWSAPEPVFEKIEEETRELLDVVRTGAGKARIREELGDLLFAVANVARHLDVDAESALRAANLKFRRRFNRMMARMEAEGTHPAHVGLLVLNANWDRVKAEERFNPRIETAESNARCPDPPRTRPPS